MTQPYIIGAFSFKTFGDVRIHCRQLLAGGTRVLPAADRDFVISLLSYHPYGKLKLRLGAIAVKVAPALIGTSLCFYIQGTDGTWHPFSYKKCAASTKSSPVAAQKAQQLTKRLKAYRATVEDQTFQWRVETLATLRVATCSCGSTEHLAVDHAETPFIELINRFERSFKFAKYPKVKEDGTKINGLSFVEDTEAHKTFVRLWKQYHKENAKYSLLCRKCNSAKGASGYKYLPIM